MSEPAGNSLARTDTVQTPIYRYPGFQPFQDNAMDRQLFYGRDEEKERLLHKILASRIVVLYGKSGMGKTSLLNAGVFQELRQRKYIPLVIRLHEGDKSLLEIVYERIASEVHRNKENNYLAEWEPGKQTTLWEYFKTVEFWSHDDELLTPVIILDQFEELFTRNSDIESRSEFIKQLSDLVRGRIPLSVSKQMAQEEATGEATASYSHSPPDLKIVIAIREAHYGHLQILARKIPEIFDNRFRLEPLSRENAHHAITEPASKTIGDTTFDQTGFTYSDNAVEEILDFLCGRSIKGTNLEQSVEPFQLQQLCQKIEEKAQKKDNRKIETADLGGNTGMQRILEDFYNDEMAALDSRTRKNVQNLIEKGLIKNGIRVPLHSATIEDEFKVSGDTLETLIRRRILRAEEKRGNYLYELSHDTLIKPILDSKVSRKTATYEKRLFSTMCIAVILAVGLISTFWWLPRYFYQKGMNAASTTEKIKYFTRATYMPGPYAIAHCELAKALLTPSENHDPEPDLAKIHLEEAIEQNELFYEAHFILGNLYKDASEKHTKQEDKEKAKDSAIFHYVQASKKQGFYDANFALGSLYISFGEMSNGIKYLKVAAQNCPEDIDLFMEMTNNLSTDDTIDILTIGADRFPDNAYLSLALANILYSERKYDEAILHYSNTESTKEELTNNAKENMALCYFHTNQFEKAIEYFEKSEDFVSADKNIKVWIKNEILARIYSFHGESLFQIQDYSNAIKLFQQAIEINDRNTMAYRGIVKALVKNNQPDTAAEYERRGKIIESQNIVAPMQ